MSLVNDLLISASVIRDASQEGENTALRVGGFLVSLIQAIVESLPNTIFNADSIGVQTTESSVIVSFGTKSSDGQAGVKQITIPVASNNKAGLMTAQDRIDLTNAIESAGQALLKAGNALYVANQALDESNSVRAALNALMNGDVTNAIENFNEVIDFLDGITDDKKLSGLLNDLRTSINLQSNRIDGIERQVGEPEGIAPLDEEGKVPSEYLHDGLGVAIVEFAGFVDGVNISVTAGSGVSGSVKYVRSTGRFVLSSGTMPNVRYYCNWAGRERWGDMNENGATPRMYMIYYDSTSGLQYMFNGSELVPIGTNIVIGEDEGTAYEGSKGAELEVQIADICRSLWPLTLTASTNPSLAEYTGSPVSVAVTGSIKVRGSNVPNSEITSVTMKVGSASATSLANSASIIATANVSAEGTTAITLTANASGMPATTSVNVVLVKAMYFGFASSVSTEANIKALTKQSIKTSPKGDYSMNNTSAINYLWLCVPSTMNISEVTSSGFTVPMQSPVTISGYKCYRSSSAINPGTMNFKIS